MKQLKKYLYLLFFIGISLPLLNYRSQVVKEEALSGSFDVSETKLQKFSWSTFEDGSFQQSFEAYWNQNLGFKKTLIRTYNQFNYSLFDQTNARDVIVGKRDMLFPEAYIKSYLGVDAIGKDSMNGFLGKAREVQQLLEARGKGFVLLITPGKASIYPENIPERYWTIFDSTASNYDLLKKEAQVELQIFDAREILRKKKGQLGNYAVFPKNGVHWTGNTVTFIADSLVTYLNQEFKLGLSEIIRQKGEATVEDYRYTDYDIGEAMNLLWNVADDSLYYPKISYHSKGNKKPRLLSIGDSFLQSFYGFYGIFDSIFDPSSQLWFYNKIIDKPWDLAEHRIKTGWLDLEKELNRSELVILEMTEENIRQKGYGFLEDVIKALRKDEFSTENTALFNKLMKDTQLNQRAEAYYQMLGYEREELLKAMVRNQLENKWLIDFDYDKEVKLVMQSIRADEDWLQAVKEKAIQKNITLEESIRLDAVWVVNDKLGFN